MDILFCYYDDVNHDARAYEELLSLSRIGYVYFVSYTQPKEDMPNVNPVITKVQRNYLQFLYTAYRTIKMVKPALVFLHDNYCAPIIRIVRKIAPNTKIIYDMSELYLGRFNIKRPIWVKIKSILLGIIEYNYLLNTDAVLSPNIERAFIAKGYYGLKEVPYIFDNIHVVQSTVPKGVVDKYTKVVNRDKFNIIYAGGLDSAAGRDTVKLMKDVSEMGNRYQLYIAGKYNIKNDIVEQYITKPNSNIHYLGMLDRCELRHLYSLCNANVVTFELNTINNIFCASGKFYEGFFEGLPAIVSENPPLVRVCTEYGVGVVAFKHDYVRAIKQAELNNEKLIDNVKKYIKTIDYDSRIDRLTEFINKVIMEAEY